MKPHDIRQPVLSGRSILLLLVSMVLGIGLVFFLWPLLQAALFDHVPAWPWPHVLALLALMTLCSVLAYLALGWLEPRWSGAGQNQGRMPLPEAVAELRTVAPYLNVLSQQLEGTLQETERGVLPLVTDRKSVV